MGTPPRSLNPLSVELCFYVLGSGGRKPRACGSSGERVPSRLSRERDPFLPDLLKYVGIVRS
jgi:hypothetical protein